MDYQLNINIDSDGLNNIYSSGQSVVLVKSVVAGTGSSSDVVWVSFQPFQQNTVTWTETYGIYASSTSIQSGATINRLSSVEDVSTGLIYTFASGSFTSGQGGSSSVYTAENAQQNGLNFGLSQSATINGVQVDSPLNIVPVNNNQTVTFEPLERVAIFLYSTSNNGVVISSVAGNALNVTLSSSNPSANIGFNDANNTFYLESSAQLSHRDVALALR